MTSPDHLVIALDDDPSILSSLQLLLADHGHPLRTHGSSEDFFCAAPPEVPACLLLEQQLGGGVRGTDVFTEMHRRGWNLPTIFLTAHGNIPLVVEAMRAGADGFLSKPYDPGQLLGEIDRALDRSRSLADEHRKLHDLQERAATPTRREREILGMVVDGNLNKEIADLLGIALITVKIHRGRVMHKLGAGNPAELGRLAIQAGIVGPS